jgi:colicin import membrane protein
MTEEKKDSVLYSLKELQQIEDDRQAGEVESRQRQELDARQAAEQAEQAAQKAAEHATWEEEERKRQEVEAAQRLEHEENERLAQVDRAAREAAERELEVHRREVEEKAKADAKKLPWKAIGSVIVLLLAGLGAFGFYAYKKGLEKDAADLARKSQQKKLAEFRKQLSKEEAKFKSKEETLQNRLAKLKKDIEKEKDKGLSELRRKQGAKLRSEIAAVQAARVRAKASARKRAKRLGVKCDPKDPLCGT